MPKEITQPDFLVIPRVLITDANLQPSDRFVYGAIYWFAQLGGSHCIASNKRIGETANVNQRSVTNSLIRLQESGYIKVVMEKEGVRQEIQPLVRYVKVAPDSVSSSIHHTSTDVGGVHQTVYRRRTSKEEETVSIAKLADKAKVSRESEAIKELFQSYKDLYVKMISDREPHFNWAICHRLARPLVSKFGVDHLKRLLRAYLENEDKFYRTQAWSLTCFLSANTINKLNQNL